MEAALAGSGRPLRVRLFTWRQAPLRGGPLRGRWRKHLERSDAGSRARRRGGEGHARDRRGGARRCLVHGARVAHDPKAASYGLEAAEKLGVDPARVLKTLVADVDGTLTVAIVPVATQFDLKALGKRVTMADPKLAD